MEVMGSRFLIYGCLRLYTSMEVDLKFRSLNLMDWEMFMSKERNQKVKGIFLNWQSLHQEAMTLFLNGRITRF